MTNRYFNLKVIALAFFMALAVMANAQLTPLEGAKICLDPGHGGQDSNDRPTELGIGTTYYESDAVWEVIGYLDTMLVKLGADTKITRITNDPDSPLREPSLSDRVQVGNAFGSDYFHSFHTNGSDNKSANYTLMLFAGSADDNPDDPNALAMAQIMTEELFVYMRTTNAISRADIPFTGFTNGLGVLNNLNMPGTLSECSFHSNTDEGRRLMSKAYRKAAAWACVKSFLAYYEIPALPYGEVGGIVTDREGNALNGIKVTLNPGEVNERTFNGDDFLNGYFLFDWLAVGEYQVLFEKTGYDPQLKQVTVSEGGYSEIDASLGPEGGAPSQTVLKYVAPFGSDGVKAEWLPNGELTLAGYRLYYATDDTQEDWALAADESTLMKQTTEVSISSKSDFVEIPANDVYHFKLTAVAESGSESSSGFTFSRSSSMSGDKVLIVDGFDRRDGSFTDTYHTFSSDYFKAIRETRNVEVTTTRNEYVLDATFSLTNYDLVVWYLGDESTVKETFDASEQALLKSYLESGGKLFVSGSEVAWDLGSRGSDTDQDFLNNYLKAQFVRDGAEVFTPAKGVAGTVFEGLEVPFGITYREDYPDDILPTAGAIAIFDYNIPDTHGGIAFTGRIGGGTQDAGVVYISFPLETAEAKLQNLVMDATLKYLLVGTTIPAAPVVFDDEGATASNGLAIIDVLANDRDINEDVDIATLAIAEMPTHGQLSISEAKFVYQADTRFEGLDTFKYTIADATGLVSNIGTVTMTVQEVIVLNAEIGEFNESMILFPNPTHNTTYLQVESGERGDNYMSWKIYDLEGRELAAQDVNLNKGINTIDLNTEQLRQGTYFIQVLNRDQSYQLKLIKE